MKTGRFTYSRKCIQGKVFEAEVKLLYKELNPCKNFEPGLHSGNVRRKVSKPHPEWCLIAASVV